MEKTINIRKNKIGDNNPVFFIAEIGGNHNGDIHLAKRMVDAACHAGAQAVKFQTFIAENVLSRKSPYYEEFKKEQLSYDDFKVLAEYAAGKGVIFFSTPFDFESVDFLDELNVPAYKIASCDINNYPLLEKIAEKRKPTILSTGASAMEEVEEAVNYLTGHGVTELALMQCSALYPAGDEEINLRVISTFKEKFQIPVGLSDHSLGVEISLAGVALGASIIERHFTTDRSLPGGDNDISVLPEELKSLVEGSRKIGKALGKENKEISAAEREIQVQIRRSLVAAKYISKGEIFTKENLAIKRPGQGLSPDNYTKVLGMRANSDIEPDEIITLDMVDECV